MPLGFKQRLRKFYKCLKHGSSHYHGKKGPGLAFSSNIEMEIIYLIVFFFSGAYGRWFICICPRSQLSPLWGFLLQTLNKTAILLCVPEPPVSWGHDKWRADVHGHICLCPPCCHDRALFPPQMLSFTPFSGKFWVYYYRIWPIQYRAQLTYFLLMKSLPELSHEPVTLTTS